MFLSLVNTMKELTLDMNLFTSFLLEDKLKLDLT